MMVATEEPTAIGQERVQVFAGSPERARQIAEPFAGLAEDVRIAVLSENVSNRTSDIVRDGVKAVTSRSATTVLIDAQWGATDQRTWPALCRMRLVALRAELAASELPASLELLSALRVLPIEERYMVVVFLVESPSVALTQEILRLGADWVWPHISGVKLPTLVPRIRAAVEDKAPGSRALKVLVVENSRIACERLRVELEDFAEVVFVGADKAGNDFNIEPPEAIEVFRSGGYDVVVVDLALSGPAERNARARFLAGEDVQLATFYEAQSESDRQLIKNIWAGLEVIKGIRSLSSEVAIVAMSVYLGETIAIDIMKMQLGQEVMRSLTLLAKVEPGFEELREVLKSFQRQLGR